MRIDEVISNDAEEIDEANPISFGNKIGTALKTMNPFSSDSRMAGQGQADINKRAMDFYKRFAFVANRNKTPMNQVPQAAILDWMRVQKLGNKLPPGFETMDPIDLANKENSTKFWTGLAAQAYGAEFKKTGGPRGTQAFGDEYGISDPTPPPPPPPPPLPPKTITKRQRAAINKAISSGTLSPAEINALKKLLAP